MKEINGKIQQTLYLRQLLDLETVQIMLPFYGTYAGTK